MGIDCSGLCFMAWMLSGILIHRDAHMPEGFPVRRIDRKALQKADLIFFPGHVAMYLGDGRYVHATGYIGDCCVRMNSLDPADPLCRHDLIDAVTECGSVFRYN